MVLYSILEYSVVVSVNVERRVIEAGQDDLVREAWKLKEHIRREEGVLKQRRRFFTNAYQRSTVHTLVCRPDDELIGFVTVRRDGYVLFLAIDPAHRGKGFGRELIAAAAEDHQTVSCHARTTNEAAIEFYEHIGFEIERRVDNYYEDGGAAYYLTLGEGNGGLREKLSEFVRK